ncbi:DUF3598 family protein [Pseudanabaena sp. FACHB-1998]|uniref:DUF3598 family protein n=1 Tax=Pseudanabaena sp. FACHB-1998 TaxID=2692858 RepID=UPI0016815CCF|nr:DUF3598 family protein [Pseudanabaena sp. FACHB-1998]MBD2176877.1 DUF3598 family protein [Pseudanabaena sp. FACHB-1998]
MRSQWDCLLQNLGCWQGSFTHLSKQGEVLNDIPSETSLELKDDQSTMRQVVRRFYDGQPQDLVLEYRSLNKSTVFFENGAFSQGSLQFSPYSDFGAELGLIHGDCRMRIVILYKQSQLDSLTFIREHLPNSPTPERPALTLEALLGKWEGEAVTIAADWLEPESTPTTTEWKREGDRVNMSLQMSSPSGNQKFDSIAHVDPLNSHILHFQQSPQQISSQSQDLGIQTIFLPDGASITCPQAIVNRQQFRLSISWLLEPNLHQRMIRSYDSKGGWSSISLVTERKVG